MKKGNLVTGLFATHSNRLNLLCLLFLVVVILAACRAKSKNQNDKGIKTTSVPACALGKSLDSDSLSYALTLAAKYLETQVQENGQFVYRRMYADNQTARAGYNFLRHSGTIYAMAQADRIKKDKNQRKAMFAAGAFLKQTTIAKLPGQGESILAVWSKKEITKSPKPSTTKLGGAGLGLLALLALEEIQAGYTSIDTLRGLGEYILFMQKQDGTYYSRYDPVKQVFDEEFTSLYYPGEAALALFSLYEIDPLEKWFDAGLHFLTHMARERVNQSSEYDIVDHWSLLATRKLFYEYRAKLDTKTYQLLLDHAYLNSKNIVFKLRQLSDRKALDLYTGNINSVATQLEGLISIFPYLRLSAQQEQEYCEGIKIGVQFLLDAQLRAGDKAGAFTKKPLWHPLYKQASTNSEIRIDNIQHSMSAIYWALLAAN